MYDTLKDEIQSSRTLVAYSIALALAVIDERARKLSIDDRRDLAEFMKEWLDPESNEEDVENAWSGMLETFKQPRGRARPLEFLDDDVPLGTGLKNWVDFVSAKIRELRKSTGLTQTQLAERSGLPQSHISRLEAGKHSPSRSTLEKIASALGRPLAELDPSSAKNERRM